MKDSIGIGIIGTGFARRVQIPAFLAVDGARVVSVASADSANARTTAEEFGIGHHTANWQETIQRPDVDLVCITTPPKLHREMTLFAIEQGKHVLCEKPMAMNVPEAEEMLVALDGSDLIALIDFELRFQHGRQRAFEMLRENAIGKVRHTRYLFQAPHRGDPDIGWNWWSDADEGGGALGAINSHVIDSFNWFLGTQPSEVFCQLQSHIKIRRTSGGGEARPVTSDDQANMILRFAEGELTADATGLVSVSMIEGPGYINRIEFFGEDGALRVEHRGDVYIAGRGGGEWKQVEVKTGRAVGDFPDTGFSRGFSELASALVNAIRSGMSKLEHGATFEDGIRVQRVLDAARESNSTGCIVRLN